LFFKNFLYICSVERKYVKQLIYLVWYQTSLHVGMQSICSRVAAAQRNDSIEGNAQKIPTRWIEAENTWLSAKVREGAYG
jgi:hypothetical protein